MLSQTIREVVRHYTAIVNREVPLDELEQVVHPDVILPEDVPNGMQGIEGIRSHLINFPKVIQSRQSIEDIIVEGDKAAIRFLIQGKHVGEIWGFAATNKEFTIEEILIAQFRDGRISRIWRLADRFALFEQVAALAKPRGA